MRGSYDINDRWLRWIGGKGIKRKKDIFGPFINQNNGN